MSPLLTLVLCLSLVVGSVNAHDLLQQRGLHDYNMKRAMMRKRAPLPQGSVGPVVGAAPLPSVLEPTSTSTTTGDSQSTTSLSTSSPASSTTTESKVTSSSVSSVPPASVSQKSAVSTSSVSTSSDPPPQITPTTDNGAGGVSTIIVPGVTHTSSVTASESVVPDQQSNTSTAQVKSTTLTVLVAIAASIGGIFIVWTIFRKWKLSSSKEFDRRLNPIDWQPTNGEDDQIPGHARRPSVGSLHSSSHGHGTTGLSRVPSNHSHSNPFDDFDSPAQRSSPVQVGGYADLARGSSPTQMQENNQYGPSYNQGVTPLPLHHQGGYNTGY